MITYFGYTLNKPERKPVADAKFDLDGFFSCLVELKKRK